MSATTLDTIQIIKIISAAFGTLSMSFVAKPIGKIGAEMVSAVGKNPGAGNQILRIGLTAIALTESALLFILLVVLLLLF